MTIQQSLKERINSILWQVRENEAGRYNYGWGPGMDDKEALEAILSAVKAAIPEKRTVQSNVPYPVTALREVEAYNAALNEVREKLK